LTGVFLGPEFPSLLGSLFGLSIMTFAARKGFLVPKDSWEFPKTNEWPASWSGKLEAKIETLNSRGMSLWLAWLPYLLLALFLVLTRLPQLPIGAALKTFSLGWKDIFGTGIAGTTTPLYLPAAILIFVVFLTYFLHKMRFEQIKSAFMESSKILWGAGFVLVFTVPMVRVYINSGVNELALASMPIAMAEWVALNVGKIWPLFAPTIGALGAFIAGSNTVSNLMFSLFQYGIAERLLISGAMVVALQAVGAAAGNMIAIHNVVAASATVGLLGQEGTTLRKTIIPTLYYLAFVGIIGLIAIYFMNVSDPLLLK
jgi:lactate permease